MIEQTHIIVVMILGFSAMVLMAGFIVTFIVLYQRRQITQEKQLNEVQRNYQKSLLETALDSEEAERRRMAEELHDDIGVMLSLTKMSVNQLIQKVGDEDSPEKALIDNVKNLLDETMQNVRRISKALVPSTLEKFGLEAAIDDLVSKASSSGGPEVTYTDSGESSLRHTAKTELALFRVVQELLNNAIKHASATHISIRLFSSGEMLVLVVEDNGAGFDPVAAGQIKSGGLGLKNIESRLSIINGKAVYRNLQPGTSVRIEVPLVDAEPA